MTMNHFECIVTDRLIIRPLHSGDENDVLEILRDDYTARMVGFKPFESLDEAALFISRWEYSGYAITERCSDTVIGILQFPMNFHKRTARIGYCLGEQYRGKGYMTEAVEAIKEYAFTIAWMDEIELHVFCGNEPSRNVALKCGFHPDYESYKENIFSPYGTVESEERFTITSEDFEWEQRGETMLASAA